MIEKKVDFFKNWSRSKHIKMLARLMNMSQTCVLGLQAAARDSFIDSPLHFLYHKLVLVTSIIYFNAK